MVINFGVLLNYIPTFQKYLLMVVSTEAQVFRYYDLNERATIKDCPYKPYLVGAIPCGCPFRLVLQYLTASGRKFDQQDS
jgi:hypothetical protein